MLGVADLSPKLNHQFPKAVVEFVGLRRQTGRKCRLSGSPNTGSLGGSEGSTQQLFES